jgi:hypothetical protein
MADPAGSMNGDDLNIKVGAEIDLDEATKATVKSYEDMAARLKGIATDAAKELSEQFAKVAKGIRDGAFNADALSQATAELDKAAASAELSDNAISSMAQGLDRAAKNSRTLADYMNRADQPASRLARGVGALSKWLDGVAPNAKKTADFLGGVAQKIPGVSSFVTKMPAMAGAIGVAFKAVAATVGTVIGAMREFRAMRRDAMSRDISVQGENTRNERVNRTADLDLRERRRKEEIEDAKAIAETENEILRLDTEAEAAKKLAGISNPLMREAVEMKARREIEERRLNLRKEMLDREDKANEDEREANEERVKIIDDTIRAEEDRLGKMQKLQAEYTQYASERRALAMQRVKNEGMTEESEGFMERVDNFVKEDLRSWVADKVRDKAAEYGLGDMTTEEAQSKIESGEDAMRGQRQNLNSLRQERAGLVEDGRRLDRQRAKLDADRKQYAAEEELRRNNVNKEDAQRRLAIEESIAGRRADLAAAGNRLTAMGLGGGNVGADHGKDIANNTKEMVALQKETLRAFNRRGIAGDNSFNGPAIAPTARIGDFGMIWSM